tara:strand:+ start:3544 stop:17301 length:13758 start_codon:yes stop_codon:yes gene_type:complete
MPNDLDPNTNLPSTSDTTDYLSDASDYRPWEDDNDVKAELSKYQTAEDLNNAIEKGEVSEKTVDAINRLTSRSEPRIRQSPITKSTIENIGTILSPERSASTVKKISEKELLKSLKQVNKQPSIYTKLGVQPGAFRNIDLDEYKEYFHEGKVPGISRAVLDELRADRQGFWEKAWNGVVKHGLINTPLSFAENIYFGTIGLLDIARDPLITVPIDPNDPNSGEKQVINWERGYNNWLGKYKDRVMEGESHFLGLRGDDYPHYYTQLERERIGQFIETMPGAEGSANFWFDKVAGGLSYSVASGLSILATQGRGGLGFMAKGVSRLGKATGVSQSLKNIGASSRMLSGGSTIANITKRIQGSKNIGGIKTAFNVVDAGLMMSGAEASVETRETLKQLHQILTQQAMQAEGVYDPEHLSKEAKEEITKTLSAAGNMSFLHQTMLLGITNHFMFNRWMRALRGQNPRGLFHTLRQNKQGLYIRPEGIFAKNRFVNRAKNSWIGKGMGYLRNSLPGRIAGKIFTKNRLRQGAIEGFQEGSQYAINEYVKDYYLRRFEGDNTAELYDSMVYGLDKTLGTGEGREQIMIGAIVGMIMGGGIGAKRSRQEEELMLANNTNYVQSVMNSGFLEDIADNVEMLKRSKSYLEEMEMYAEEGKMPEFRTAWWKFHKSIADQMVKRGAANMYIDHLEAYKNLSEQEWKEKVGWPADQPVPGGHVEAISWMQNNVKKLEKLNDNLTAKFQINPLRGLDRIMAKAQGTLKEREAADKRKKVQKTILYDILSDMEFIDETIEESLNNISKKTKGQVNLRDLQELREDIIQEKIEKIDEALETVVDDNIRKSLTKDKEDLEERRDKNVTQFYSDSVTERFTKWAPGNTKELIEEVKNEIELLNNFRLKRMLAVDAYNLMTDEEVAQAAIDAAIFEEGQLKDNNRKSAIYSKIDEQESIKDVDEITDEQLKLDLEFDVIEKSKSRKREIIENDDRVDDLIKNSTEEELFDILQKIKNNDSELISNFTPKELAKIRDLAEKHFGITEEIDDMSVLLNQSLKEQYKNILTPDIDKIITEEAKKVQEEEIDTQVTPHKEEQEEKIDESQNPKNLIEEEYDENIDPVAIIEGQNHFRNFIKRYNIAISEKHKAWTKKWFKDNDIELLSKEPISYSDFYGDKKIRKWEITTDLYNWTAQFIDDFNIYENELSPFPGKLPEGAAMAAFERAKKTTEEEKKTGEEFAKSQGFTDWKHVLHSLNKQEKKERHTDITIERFDALSNKDISNIASKSESAKAQKKRIEEAKPKEPTPPPIDKSTLDKLAERKQAAKDRLRKRGNNFNMGINPEDLADIIEIGTIEVLQGTIKFADWSSKMISEIGHQIKPYLKSIYNQIRKETKVEGMDSESDVNTHTDHRVTGRLETARGQLNLQNVGIRKRDAKEILKPIVLIGEDNTVTLSPRTEDKVDDIPLDVKYELLANPDMRSGDQFSLEIIETDWWKRNKGKLLSEDLKTAREDWMDIPIFIKWRGDLVGKLEKYLDLESSDIATRQRIVEALINNKKVVATLKTLGKKIDNTNINNLIHEQRPVHRNLESLISDGIYVKNIKKPEGEQYELVKDDLNSILLATNRAPLYEPWEWVTGPTSGINPLLAENIKEIQGALLRAELGTMSGGLMLGWAAMVHVTPRGTVTPFILSTRYLTTQAKEQIIDLLATEDRNAYTTVNAIVANSIMPPIVSKETWLGLEDKSFTYYSPKLEEFVRVKASQLYLAKEGNRAFVDVVKVTDKLDEEGQIIGFETEKLTNIDKQDLETTLIDDLTKFLDKKKYQVDSRLINLRNVPYTSPITNIKHLNYFEYLTSEKEIEEQDGEIASGLDPISSKAILTTDVYNNKGSLYNDITLQFDIKVAGQTISQDLNVINELTKDLDKGVQGPTHTIGEVKKVRRRKKTESPVVPAGAKEGVSEVFKENPELSKIGTQQQYSEYLDNIFPDSKVKDIVYHGSDVKFDTFDKSKFSKSDEFGSIVSRLKREGEVIEGFYFLDKKTKNYGEVVLPAILNVNKLKDFGKEIETTIAGFGSDISPRYEKLAVVTPFDLEQYRRSNIDGLTGDVKNVGQEYVVFDTSQIHILGSKKDVQEFKKFVSKPAAPTEGKALYLGPAVKETFEEEKAKEHLEKLLPNYKIGIFKAIQKINNKYVHGIHENMAISLWDKAAVGIEYHEGFHGVFRTYFNDKQRSALYEEARTKYGIPTQEQVQELKDLYPNLEGRDLFRELWWEEQMAEEARVQINTRGNMPVLDKIGQALLDLYYYIKAWITDSITLRQAISMVKTARVPAKFHRNTERFTPEMSMYSLQKKGNHTNEQIESITDVLALRFLTVKYKAEKNNKVVYPRQVFQSVKEHFLRNAWSLPTGGPVSLSQAELLYKLRNTDEEAYFDNVDELELRQDELGDPIVAKEIPKSTVLTRVEQHEHILDIIDNWEDEIEPITKNIINPGFETLTKTKLNLYGIEIREDFSIKMDDLGFERKIYNQSSFLTDPVTNLSPRIKAWLSQQRSNERNYLGFLTPVPFELLYRDLTMLLVGAQTLKDMKYRIAEEVAYKPYYQNILDELNNAEPRIQTDFFRAFAMVHTNHITHLEELTPVKVDNKIIWQMNVKLLGSNRRGRIGLVLSQWRANAFEKEFLDNPTALYNRSFIEDEGEVLTLREENVEKLVEAYKKINNIYKIQEAQVEVEPEQIEGLAEFMKVLGSDISNSEVKEYLNNGILVEGKKISNFPLYIYLIEGTGTNSPGIRSLIDAVADIEYTSKTGIGRGKLFGKYKGIKENPQDIFKAFSSTLKRLANVQATFRATSAASFVNDLGKQIYPINTPTTFDDKTTRIKNGDYFNDPKVYNNPLLRPLEGSDHYWDPWFYVLSKNLNGAREVYQATEFSSHKKKGEDIATTEYEGLTAGSSLLVRLNAFLNNNNSIVANYTLPTQGDRRRMSNIEFFRVSEILKLTSGLNKMGYKSLLYGSVIQELTRIYRTKQDLETLSKNQLSRNYHYAKTPGDNEARGVEFILNDMLEQEDLDVSPNISIKDIDLQRYFEGKDNIVSREKIEKKLMNLVNLVDSYLESFAQQIYGKMLEAQIIRNNGKFELKTREDGTKFVSTDPKFRFQTYNARDVKSTKRAHSRLDRPSVIAREKKGNPFLAIAREFVKDTFIAKNAQIKLYRGDPAFAKNTEDFYKRFSSISTPGVKTLIKGDIEQHPNWGVNPVMRESSIYDITTEGMATERAKAAENYRKRLNDDPNTTAEEADLIANSYMPGASNKTDSFAVLDINFVAGFMQGTEGWTPSHEEALENYNKAPEGQKRFIDNKGNYPIFPPFKTYHDTLIYKDNRVENHMRKNHYAILLEEATKNYPILNDLRQRMALEGLYRTGQGILGETQESVVPGFEVKPIEIAIEDLKPIDAVNFDSASKLAVTGIHKIGAGYGLSARRPDYALKFEPGEFRYLNTVNLPMNDLRTPQSISEDHKKSKWGTQIMKIVRSNLYDEVDYVIEAGLETEDISPTKLTGKQLRDLYNWAGHQMLKQSHENLMKELGYSQLQKLENSKTSTQEQRDGARLEFLQRYRDFLIGQNKDKKLPETYTEALHIVKDELVGWTYQMPLSFPSFKNKNEQNSYSLFRNNILTQRLNGTAAVNIAEIGGHAVDKELKFVTVKGERVDEAEFDQIAHAEIAISWQLSNIAGLKPGMVIEIDQLPESVRRAIIYRTPSEGRNSMLPALIKYILPQNVTHAIMVPGEITTQMGTDFDFDKSTVIMPNFKIDKLTESIKKYLRSKDFSSELTKEDTDWIRLRSLNPNNYKDKINWSDRQYEIAKGASRYYQNNLFRAEKVRVDYNTILKDGKIIVQELENLSRAQLENIIFDISEAALRNPLHLREMLIPLDILQGEIADQAERTKRELPEYSKDLLFSDPYTEIEVEMRNKAGSDMIGPHALTLAGRNTDMNLNITNNSQYDIKFYNTQTINISEARNRANQLKNESKSGYLSAAVDNAKTLLLYFVNENHFTMPITIWGLIKGMTSNDVYNFKMQPLIRKISEDFINNERRGNEILDTIYKNITEYIRENREWFKENSPEFIGITKGDILDQNSFEMDLEDLQNIKPEFVNPAEQIKYAVNAYLFRKAGQSYMKFNKALLADRIKDTSESAAIQIYYDLLDEIEKENIIIDGLSQVYTEKVEDSADPLMWAFRKFGIEKAREFNDRLFSFNKPAMVTQYNLLKKATAKLAIDKSVYKALEQHVFLHIMSQEGSPFADIFTKDTIENLHLNKDTNIFAQTKEILSKYPELSRNSFMENYESHEHNIKPEYSFIKMTINNMFIKKKYDKDALTRGLHSMLYESHTYTDVLEEQQEISNYADNIIKSLLLTVGFKVHAQNFMDIIPTQWWMSKTNDQGLNAREYWKRIQLVLNDPLALSSLTSSEIIHDFMRLNGNLKRLWPTVSQKKLKANNSEINTFYPILNKEDSSVYNRETQSYAQYMKVFSYEELENRYFKLNSIDNEGRPHYQRVQMKGEGGFVAEVNIKTSSGRILQDSVIKQNRIAKTTITMPTENNGFYTKTQSAVEASYDITKIGNMTLDEWKAFMNIC